MRKIKQAPMPKMDVEQLSKEERRQLADLSKHPGFVLLKSVADSSIKKMVMIAAMNEDVEAEEARKLLMGISSMRGAIAFLLDAPQRSRETLKTDKEEK